MYFVCKFGLFLVELEKWPPELKLLWDLTTDEFLDLLLHILELTTTGNRSNCEISLVGQSGCGLSINM